MDVSAFVTESVLTLSVVVFVEDELQAATKSNAGNAPTINFSFMLLN